MKVTEGGARTVERVNRCRVCGYTAESYDQAGHKDHADTYTYDLAVLLADYLADNPVIFGPVLADRISDYRLAAGHLADVAHERRWPVYARSGPWGWDRWSTTDVGSVTVDA